jgi:predicted dehydrogenase
MNRRRFLTQTSLASGTMLWLPNTEAKPRERASANEKIVIGVIGCNNMGNGIMNHALNQPNVACAAICDLDNNIAAKRAEEVFKKTGKKPLLYTDFRQLLENKDIDAVVVGTPDHWHCLPTVYACEAGKDVYVEKPLANSIGECTAMVKATRRYNRIVQVGQQQRSGEHWQKAMQLIQSGGIGTLRKVHAWANFNYAIGQPKVPDEAAPADINFDMWLGPAPQRSYNKTRHHGAWRFFWDYGGGLMTDWGAHLLDIALWVKNVQTAPLSVVATGGNYYPPDFAHETFDTMSVLYQLPDYTISWEHTAGAQNGPYGRSYGLAFVGNDATLVIDRGGWELFPEIDKGGYKVPAVPKRGGKETHEEHVRNWLECIRSRKEPNCPIENGRLVAMYAHMGNIALRTNSRLEWSEASQSFGKNETANALITPNYRKPWVFPKL